MITYYCPACWNTVAADAQVCPICGANIQDSRADIVDKYIAALRHPEPMTRLRAAWMLGRMRAERAVPALVQVVRTRQAYDPYVVSAAVKSLGLIGHQDAVPCLIELLRDASASFMARMEAAEALNRIGSDDALAALADAQTYQGRTGTQCGGEDSGVHGGEAVSRGQHILPAGDTTRVAKVSTAPSASWLNRNVVGMALASLFGDAGHEMATSILPVFLTSIGAPPMALGVIEGVADAISSFTKMGAGWLSDRVARRKPIAVAGYALTGVTTGLFALTTAWPYVAAARAVGWLGRGARGQVRDALLADSVEASARGRGFGFHRAGDTLGAILGPVLGLILMNLLAGHVDTNTGYRYIFALTLIPGLLATCSFALLVRERARSGSRTGGLLKAVRDLPPRFKMFLVAVGIFGAGDFAHSLLILRASYALEPVMGAAQAGQLAVALYVLHNVLYAGMSYPIGALADRLGKRLLLASGYSAAAVMGIGWLWLTPSVWHLGLLFALGGIYIAAEDSLEGALAANLLPSDLRGTGYGMLATVNGIGDFMSSFIVGALWQGISPAAGFGYATAMFIGGAAMMYRLK